MRELGALLQLVVATQEGARSVAVRAEPTWARTTAEGLLEHLACPRGGRSLRLAAARTPWAPLAQEAVRLLRWIQIGDLICEFPDLFVQGHVETCSVEAEARSEAKRGLWLFKEKGWVGGWVAG